MEVLLHSQLMSIQVPCNLKLRAGNVVKVEFEKLKDLNLKLTTQYHLENSPAIIEKIAKEDLGMTKKRPKKINYE